MRKAVERLRQTFVAKHGREPGPDDLLFPALPHAEAIMVEGVKAAGLDTAESSSSGQGSARLCRLNG